MSEVMFHTQNWTETEKRKDGNSSVVERLSSMNETRSLFSRSVKAEEGEEEADGLKTVEWLTQDFTKCLSGEREKAKRPWRDVFPWTWPSKYLSAIVLPGPTQYSRCD